MKAYSASRKRTCGAQVEAGRAFRHAAGAVRGQHASPTVAKVGGYDRCCYDDNMMTAEL